MIKINDDYAIDSGFQRWLLHTSCPYKDSHALCNNKLHITLNDCMKCGKITPKEVLDKYRFIVGRE